MSVSTPTSTARINSTAGEDGRGAGLRRQLGNRFVEEVSEGLRFAGHAGRLAVGGGGRTGVVAGDREDTQGGAVWQRQLNRRIERFASVDPRAGGHAAAGASDDWRAGSALVLTAIG
jgi:hypothetical protein